VTIPEKRTRKKTPEYTESQKIAAVTALRLHNGLTEAGMQAVHDMLNPSVSKGTMWQWLKIYGDKVDQADKTLARGYVNIPAVVSETKTILLRRMQTIADKILEATENDNSIYEATLQQRFITLGIIYDKTDKLLGLTPEKMQAWATFDEECRLSGLDTIEMINDYRDTMRDKRIASAQAGQIYHDIEASQ
jgi:hypothetical protein